MLKSDLLYDDYQPVFLGNTKEARRLAKKIFKKFGVVSYLCDKKGGFFSFFCPETQFLSIAGSKDSDILCEELLYLASFDPYCVYIAVPCDEDYGKCILAQRDKLESAYIIKKPCELLSALSGFEKSLQNQA